MKKFISIIAVMVILVTTLFLLTGCGEKEEVEQVNINARNERKQ